MDVEINKLADIELNMLNHFNFNNIENNISDDN